MKPNQIFFLIFCFLSIFFVPKHIFAEVPVVRSEQVKITLTPFTFKMLLNLPIIDADYSSWLFDYGDGVERSVELFLNRIKYTGDQSDIDYKKYKIEEVCKAAQTDKTEKYYPFNPPAQISLEISPTGKHFLIKLFADQSFLYESDSGKYIDKFSSIPENKNTEIILGFNRQGDLYCGIQSINPMIILRSISTGKKLKSYEFQGINFAPADKTMFSQLQGDDVLESGIIYNYLSGPVESPDGKYTAFTFTLHQFHCLFAVVLVADNEKGRIIAKHLIDTSNWDFHKTRFLFNQESSHLLFQDGRKKIRLFDIKKDIITSVFTVPLYHGEKYAASTKEIDSFFFTDDGKVIVCMKMPRVAFMRSEVEGLPSEPLVMSYLWDPDNGTITSPPWSVKDSYTLRYWLSPDRNTVATYHVSYDPNDFTIVNRKNCTEGISFWDTKSGELLHTINGHIESVSFFPNWEKMSIISFNEFPEKNIEQPIPTVTGTKTTYDLSNMINRKTIVTREFRTWQTQDGKFSTVAQFVSIQDNKVTLKKQDSKEITVPIEKLSDTDRTYIEQQYRRTL
jgi:hypothetical protein